MSEIIKTVLMKQDGFILGEIEPNKEDESVFNNLLHDRVFVVHEICRVRCSFYDYFSYNRLICLRCEAEAPDEMKKFLKLVI